MNFGGTTGYFWLDSWILANVVQLRTQRYCQRFLSRRNDPCGRQFDQMTQAARSGVANIAEGSARRKTSTETEMRLTDVARSSLSELAGDYLNPLLLQKQVPWPKEGESARAIYAIQGVSGTGRSAGTNPARCKRRKFATRKRVAITRGPESWLLPGNGLWQALTGGCVGSVLSSEITVVGADLVV